MFNKSSPPCEFCLDEGKKGCHKATKGCDCTKCKLFNECTKKLRPTIRVTLKCTQACSHCCFESSPELDQHMSVKTAKKVARFIEANNIFSINLMGGEVFCNPNYKEIVKIFANTGRRIRLVSNGDWVKEEPGFAEYMAQFKNLYICISKDQWHTNEHVIEAEKLLKQNNIVTKVSDLNETDFSMVPIGRGLYDSFGLYSMMGTWCSNPERHYTFLINEEGVIHKCDFGIWEYANVNDYQEGGFGPHFKKMHKQWHDNFIPHCKACIKSYRKQNGLSTFF